MVNSINFEMCFETNSRLLSIQAEFYGINKNRNKIPGCEANYCMAEMKNNMWIVSVDKKDLEKAEDVGMDVLFDEAKYLNFIQKAQQAQLDYLELSQMIYNRKIETYSNHKLLDLFKAVFEKYAESLSYYRFTNSEYSAGYEKWLKEHLVDVDICLVMNHTPIDLSNTFSFEYNNRTKSHKSVSEFDEIGTDIIARISELANYRLQARKCFMQANKLNLHMFNEIYRRINTQYNCKIDERTKRLFSYDDIIGFLTENNVEIENIRDRSNNIIYILSNDSFLLSSKSKQSTLQVNEAKHVKTPNVLNGNNVSVRGLFKGVVFNIPHNKIITEKEMAYFQEGVIIVSNSLHLHVMFSGLKINGIITDEGGILSHAGIITRELGIPCITGTKNATQILNTGDLVSMDCNNGNIFMLKKSEASENESQVSYVVENQRIDYCSLVDAFNYLDVGNKTLMLSRFSDKFNVPEGICLREKFCAQLSEWDELTHKLNIMLKENQLYTTDTIYTIIGFAHNWLDKIQKQTDLSEDLMQQIIPYYPVIVRSSGLEEDGENNSYAGMLESITNISASRIKEAIFDVFKSAYSYEAISYRKINNLALLPTCPAILIQKQIKYKYIGTMFSINPSNENENMITIEISSDDKQTAMILVGKTDMDFYRIESGTDMLDTHHVNALRDMALTLEESMHYYVDIEWCIDENDDLYLLQVRPVTAITDSKKYSDERNNEYGY